MTTRHTIDSTCQSQAPQCNYMSVSGTAVQHQPKHHQLRTNRDHASHHRLDMYSTTTCQSQDEFLVLDLSRRYFFYLWVQLLHSERLSNPFRPVRRFHSPSSGATNQHRFTRPEVNFAKERSNPALSLFRHNNNARTNYQQRRASNNIQIIVSTPYRLWKSGGVSE